jgi:hypothetical protein
LLLFLNYRKPRALSFYPESLAARSIEEQAAGTIIDRRDIKKEG